MAEAEDLAKQLRVVSKALKTAQNMLDRVGHPGYESVDVLAVAQELSTQMAEFRRLLRTKVLREREVE